MCGLSDLYQVTMASTCRWLINVGVCTACSVLCMFMQAHDEHKMHAGTCSIEVNLFLAACQNPVLAGSCVSVSWLVAVGANIAGSVS